MVLTIGKNVTDRLHRPQENFPSRANTVFGAYFKAFFAKLRRIDPSYWVGLSLVLLSRPGEAHSYPGDTFLAHRRQDAVSIAAEQALEHAYERSHSVQNLIKAFGPKPAQADPSADPALVGHWSEVDPWPVVAVHAALLPNGKVLAYDSVGDGSAESYVDHNFTRVVVWDPATLAKTLADASGYNLFCSGLAHLPNGQEFLAGGNLNNKLDGRLDTHLFDYVNNTWTAGPNMYEGRWYPSVTPLANGEMLITGGTTSGTSGGTVASGAPRDSMVPIPEVYTTNGTLRMLSDAEMALPLYPWMQVAPDGSVAYLGPSASLRTLTTTGTGQWTDRGYRDDVNRDYGSHAMYDIGKVLIAGGGLNSDNSAVIVDLNTLRTTATGSMRYGRRQHNLTVLADGSVLVTGGNSTGANLIDTAGSVYAAERWVPSNGQWTQLASMQQIRQYHSIALLLPDGKVLSAGGGVCSKCTADRYLSKDAEVFSPPYLYLNDGSGHEAPRPVISTAPDSIRHNTLFTVRTPQAASIRTAALVRLSSVTHSVNFEQRYVPLPFRTGTGAIRPTAPATPNIAPPGYYMLFLLDEHGVPSVAKILQLEAEAPVPTNQPPTLIDPGTQSSDIAEAVNFSLTASDPESGPLEFTAIKLPPGLSIDSATGAISGTPKTPGNYPVEVTVTDDLGSTAGVNFTWTIVASNIPQAPDITGTGNQSSTVGTAVNLGVNAVDANGDPITFAANGLPPGLGIDSTTGIISGTPTVAGSYFVTIKANDDNGRSSRMFMLWLVTEANEAPASSTGLVYEYFEGDWPSAPKLRTAIPLATGIVRKISLAPSHRNDHFALRFTGQLRIAASGEHTFYLNNDASGKLWIDGSLVVNNTGSATVVRERSATLPLGAGQHSLVVSYAAIERANQLQVKLAGPGIAKQGLPADLLIQPANGLSYEYYEGSWSALPNFNKLTPSKRGFVSVIDLAPKARKNNFALRFRGRLKISRSNLYTFYLKANPGGRVWIDGKALVGGNVPIGEERMGSRWLAEGEHDLLVGYFAKTGPKSLILNYSSPTMTKRPLTRSVLPAD